MTDTGSIIRPRARGKRRQKVPNPENSGVSASLHTIRSKSRTKSKIMEVKDEKEEQTVRSGLPFDIAVLDREAPGKYGWGKFTPDCLQCYHNPRYLLAALAFVAMTQNFLVHGVMPASIPTLRETYHFTMTDIGVMRMMFDIGMILAFLPVMKMNASGAHRARWVGIGCIIMAVGAVMCAFPHFVRQEEHHEQKDQYCNRPSVATIPVPVMNLTATGTRKRPIYLAELQFYDQRNGSVRPKTRTTPVQNGSFTASPTVRKDSFTTSAPPTMDIAVEHCVESASVQNYKYYIMAGMFLSGAGSAPYYTMGVAYLDESVSASTSALYTGVLHASFLFGVAAGGVITGGMLYIDNPRTEREMTVFDEEQQGAWWLGVLLSAILSVLAALAMLGFPRQLPRAAGNLARDAIQAGQLQSKGRGDKLEEKGVWKSVKACLGNTTYLGLITEQCAYTASATSFTVFMPLYFRTVFELPPQNAAILGGLFVVMSAFIGSICGTVFQRIFHLEPKGNLRFSLGTCLATLVFLCVFFVPCGQTAFAGVTQAYQVGNVTKRTPATLRATCNAGCSCSQDNYGPACYRGGSDKEIMYFSKCFAGCEQDREADNTTCKCVPLRNSSRGGGIVEDGRCKKDPPCPKNRLYAFILGMAWTAMVVYVRINPIQQCLLRCIAFNDRVVGLTMSALSARLIGSLPAPILMAGIIGSSCVAWKTKCGENIFCVWFNTKSLRFGVAAAAFMLTAVGAIGLVLANWSYTDPNRRDSRGTTLTTASSITPRRASGSGSRKKSKQEGVLADIP